MSLNKKLIVELSPFSLQVAVLAGDRLVACRDFSPEAKDAVTAFVTEHPGAPVALALLAPKNQFARLSNESEAAAIRSTSDLLAYAGKIANTFGGEASAVACDVSTGLAPESGQTSNWILAGAPASAVDAAKEQLAGLGLAPQATTLALPAQLGAAVSALKASPESRVALWQLNEADSQLWLVSAAGIERFVSVPVGFNQIFDAVQAELGLKFRTAAAKLFLNNAYEFGDLAGNIAGRLREPLQTALASLGDKPTAMGLIGLPVHQAWFARGIAQVLDLPLWSPDVSALCEQLGLAGEAVGSNLPACTLGLLKAASANSRTGIAWMPALLGETPTRETSVVATNAPVTNAPVTNAPTPPPAKDPAPAIVNTPVAAPASAATSPVVPAAPPSRPAPAPAPVSPAAAAYQPAPSQPRPKKSPLVLIGVGGLVVAGLAVAAVSFAMKGKKADSTISPLPPTTGKPTEKTSATSSTVAYYRFEDGAQGQPLGYGSNGAISELTGKGGEFQVKAGKPVYNLNVPFSDVAGSSNTLSAQFPGNTDVQCVATTESSLNNVDFQDFTVEAFVKVDDLTNWQTFVGRDAGSPNDGYGNFGLFYLQKTSHVADSQRQIIPNTFRVELTTTERLSLEVKSSFVVQPSTWYHVAAVGNSKEGTLTLYVDGKNVGQTKGFTGLVKPKSFSPWTIGRGQFGRKPVDYVTGSIDEVRFSNTALKPEQFLISGK